MQNKSLYQIQSLADGPKWTGNWNVDCSRHLAKVLRRLCLLGLSQQPDPFQVVQRQQLIEAKALEKQRNNTGLIKMMLVKRKMTMTMINLLMIITRDYDLGYNEED